VTDGFGDSALSQFPPDAAVGARARLISAR